MRDIKTQIIIEEGTPVEIIDTTGAVLTQTTALIGRASKQLMAEVSLETHRQGQFQYDVDITNGTLIYSPLVDTSYLVLANIPEVVQGEKIATVTRMLECNSTISVTKFDEDADDNGNITKTEQVIADGLKVYALAGKFYVEQKMPGIGADFEYRIYSASLDLEILDPILLEVNGVMKPFKVQSLDYLTFPGIVIIDVITESRK